MKLEFLLYDKLLLLLDDLQLWFVVHPVTGHLGDLDLGLVGLEIMNVF